MEFLLSATIFIAGLLFAHGNELSKRYRVPPAHEDNKQDIHDFFENASQESLTLMILFQILAISFIILKLSNVSNLIIWLSFAFLMYSFNGSYFCFKWLLVISSFMWHVCITLSKHPSLIAASIVVYALARFFWFVYKKSACLEKDNYSLKIIVTKLDTVDTNIQQLSFDVGKLSGAVNMLNRSLSSRTEWNDSAQGWFTTSSPYPLDRRREMSRSR